MHLYFTSTLFALLRFGGVTGFSEISILHRLLSNFSFFRVQNEDPRDPRTPLLGDILGTRPSTDLYECCNVAHYMRCILDLWRGT